MKRVLFEGVSISACEVRSVEPSICVFSLSIEMYPLCLSISIGNVPHTCVSVFHKLYFRHIVLSCQSAAFQCQLIHDLVGNLFWILFSI